ncbi:MAG TPA: Gfo/Idh/MocA family oxidoreductase [Chthoniobacterales bacterium]|nr:Gfo/Idh/MocA family oxidoreductase [Chthoniobacterales bacterium]
MSNLEEQQPASEGSSPANRKIKVGIVGCGEVTQIMHWPSLFQLADRFEVRALCDVSAPVLAELGRLWNIGSLATNHRELVTRQNVDAVLIANPNAFHAEVVLDAIAAGKHVLVEKPMCVTRREAEQIISAQKTSNVVVQVGYMRRYAPAFLEACEVVRKMGKIKFARVRDFIGFNSLIVNATSRVIRDEQLSESVKREAKLREEASLDEALGGKSTPALRRAYTLMIGLSSHDLSAMRELLGMPSKVLFAAQRSAGVYLTAAFDYGGYVCQFETGIDHIARFDAHLEVYGNEQVIRVQYDTPYVRNSPIRLLVTESSRQGGVTTRTSHPAWGDPFVEEWKAFYNNVTENKVPKTNPTDFGQDLELFAEMARLMY